MIDEVLALIERDPSLGRPLTGADDYLRAEIVYAATHEGARHLNDVLTRRTRISIETFHRGVARRPGGRRADGRARSAGTPSRSSARSSTTPSGSRPSGLSQEQDTDQEADAIRLGAPEIVPVA